MYREYYLFINKYPVKLDRISAIAEKVNILDLETLNFKPANSYQIDEIHLGRNAEMDPISEEKFIQYTESLRARRYTKDDEIGAVYQEMNAIEDRAKAEGRDLTDEEKTKLAEMRIKTYQMFEEKYPET